jgi:hypothetical protein
MRVPPARQPRGDGDEQGIVLTDLHLRQGAASEDGLLVRAKPERGCAA